MALGKYDGSIRVDAKLETKNFTAGVQKLSGKLRGLASVVGVVFGVTALVKFGKEAVNIASDLTEVQNVVETAFGAMSSQVDEWAKHSIKQFGMSELAAKRTASVFMAMNSGMGLTGQGASDMALRTAERSADIASFFNTSQEDAATMLKSIWTGETETLKQIGVVMTQANLDAYALANGFGKTVQQMSQSEQVMLRYQYVMEQTKLSAGDFAKTQDSWANQTRILSEQWKQFLGILGQGLIQILTPALKFLNQIMGVLIQWAQTFSAVTAALFGKQRKQASSTAASVGDVTDASNAAAAGQDALADSTKKAGRAAKGALAPFDQLNILQKDAGSSSSASAGTSAGAGETSMPALAGEIGADVTLSPNVGKVLGTMRNLINGLWDGLAPAFARAKALILPQLDGLRQNISAAWQDIKSLGSPLYDWFSGDYTTYLAAVVTTLGTIVAGLLDSFNLVFSDLWNLIIFPFFQSLVTDILPLLYQFCAQVQITLGTLFDAIKLIFDTLWTEGVAPALERISRIWTETWDLLKQKWDQWGAPIFDAIRAAIQTTGDILLHVWEQYLKPVWDNLMAAVDWLWDKHLKPFVSNFIDFIAELVHGALEIYNKFIAPIVHWLIDFLAPGIANVVGTIHNIIATIAGYIADVVGGIITALKGIIQFVVGVFTNNWQKAWEGISNIFGGIWDAISGAFKGVINMFIDLINGLLGGVELAVNKIVSVLNKLNFDVPDWVPGIGGKEFGFHLDTVSVPRIPKLAQGAVIPPNRQFAAILGDQKRGTNIEAPLNTIKQGLAEVLAQYGGRVPEKIIIQLGNKSVGEIALAEILRIQRTTGQSVIKV